MIVVERLTKRFGDRIVLSDISITLARGELVGCMGPSGAGKTTLARSIVGLIPFDSGRVTLESTTLTANVQRTDPPAIAIRRQVGLVFQHLNLWPYRTALENIIEGPITVAGRSKDAAVAEAVAWARRFGIEDRLRQYPASLSGGERQRVALIRALVMQPEYLLLDEITSALDPVAAAGIVDTLQELRADGLGLFFVTHQLDFLRRAADRVLYIADGHAVAVGDARAIIENPQDAGLQQFLSSVSKGR